MPNTIINAALVPKIWSNKLWEEMQIETFFDRFVGTSENSIIVLDNKLQKEKGDTVTFGNVSKLTGAGVDGDAVLEGNEEAINTDAFSVTINQKRHAVRLDGILSEQKAPNDMRETAKNVLKMWFAEYVDKDKFTKLTASPTSYRTVYAGGKTTENTLTDTDLLTTDLISLAKRKAKLPPAAGINRIRPIMIKGKPHYVLVAHDWQLRDLKQSDKWINAQKDANIRGEDNPLFSGADGIWDGVIIYSHESIPITTTGATSANVGHALLLGAQAGIWAVSKKLYWKEKAFDYDNQQGFAGGIIHGFKKTVFNSQDYGCLQIMTGAKAD